MDAPDLLTIEGREGAAQAQPPSPPLATGEGGLVDGREGNADRDKFDQSPNAGASATPAEGGVGVWAWLCSYYIFVRLCAAAPFTWYVSYPPSGLLLMLTLHIITCLQQVYDTSDV